MTDLTPPSAEDLLAAAAKIALKDLIGGYTKRQTQAVITERAAALKSPRIGKWISENYAARGRTNDLSAVGRGTNRHRIAFLTKEIWQGLGRIDLHLDSWWRSSVPVSELVQKRRDIGYTIVDNELYCLHKITDSNKPARLSIGLCRYEQYVSTCGLLEDETLAAAFNATKPRIRDVAAPDLDALATCPLGAHGIGVHAAIVIEIRNKRMCLLQERAYGTINHAGLTSVIPTFAFQPVLGYPTEEFDLNHQVIREFGEVLLSLPELSGRPARIEPDWFYDLPQVQRLLSAIETGGVTINLSGFGFDATNGEPNLAVLVLIKDEEYWESTRRALSPNWEGVDGRRQDLDNALQQLSEVPERWMPGSAFALSMAGRHLNGSS